MSSIDYEGILIFGKKVTVSEVEILEKELEGHFVSVYLYSFDSDHDYSKQIDPVLNEKYTIVRLSTIQGLDDENWTEIIDSSVNKILLNHGVGAYFIGTVEQNMIMSSYSYQSPALKYLSNETFDKDEKSRLETYTNFFIRPIARNLVGDMYVGETKCVNYMVTFNHQQSEEIKEEIDYLIEEFESMEGLYNYRTSIDVTYKKSALFVNFSILNNEEHSLFYEEGQSVGQILDYFEGLIGNISFINNIDRTMSFNMKDTLNYYVVMKDSKVTSVKSTIKKLIKSLPLTEFQEENNLLPNKLTIDVEKSSLLPDTYELQIELLIPMDKFKSNFDSIDILKQYDKALNKQESLIHKYVKSKLKKEIDGVKKVVNYNVKDREEKELEIFYSLKN